eukprot:3290579-Rhodomonas_salina.1
MVHARANAHSTPHVNLHVRAHANRVLALTGLECAREGGAGHERSLAGRGRAPRQGLLCSCCSHARPSLASARPAPPSSCSPRRVLCRPQACRWRSGCGACVTLRASRPGACLAAIRPSTSETCATASVSATTQLHSHFQQHEGGLANRFLVQKHGKFAYPGADFRMRRSSSCCCSPSPIRGSSPTGR